MDFIKSLPYNICALWKAYTRDAILWLSYTGILSGMLTIWSLVVSSAYVRLFGTIPAVFPICTGLLLLISFLCLLFSVISRCIDG